MATPLNTPPTDDQALATPLDTARLAPSVLIVGCGFVGRPLAQSLLQAGREVYGSTRSTDHAIDLSKMGIRPMLLSVTQKLTLASLSLLLDGRPLDVIYLIPPGKPDQHNSPHEVVLTGIANVLSSLRRANIRRAILVSSTAVYGNLHAQTEQADAEGAVIVTPDTAAAPDNPRSKLLLDGENLWRQAGDKFHVLRLCGLYGPKRIIGLSAVQQGAPLVGDPDALLNLIHVDDAVSLLMHMLGAEKIAPVELGSDGRPIARLTYYNHLATLLGLPPLKVLDNTQATMTLGIRQGTLQRAANKACDATLTRQRTGWSPRFTDFAQGIEDALRRSRKA